MIAQVEFELDQIFWHEFILCGLPQAAYGVSAGARRGCHDPPQMPDAIFNVCLPGREVGQNNPATFH